MGMVYCEGYDSKVSDYIDKRYSDVTAFSADQIDRYRSLHGITLSFHVDHDFMLVRISFSVTNQVS